MSERERAITIGEYIIYNEWNAKTVWIISSMFVRCDYNDLINYFYAQIEGCEL